MEVVERALVSRRSAASTRSRSADHSRSARRGSRFLKESWCGVDSTRAIRQPGVMVTRHLIRMRPSSWGTIRHPVTVRLTFCRLGTGAAEPSQWHSGACRPRCGNSSLDGAFATANGCPGHPRRPARCARMTFGRYATSPANALSSSVTSGRLLATAAREDRAIPDGWVINRGPRRR